MGDLTLGESLGRGFASCWGRGVVFGGVGELLFFVAEREVVLC